MTNSAEQTAATTHVDVLVVGAGPAGMAAAAAAAEAGSAVALIDGAARAGGQFWRTGDVRPSVNLQHGQRTFERLQSRAQRAGVVQLPRHHVVTIVQDEAGWLVQCAVGSEPRSARQLNSVRGGRLILATGAYDRQLPFPGWDLPGVMSAGGAQALLKGNGVLAGNRVVVAGTGPLLLPVADGLARAGARVPMVVEANSPACLLRHPRALLGVPAKFGEGAGYLGRLARNGTPYRTRSAVVRAWGSSQLETVEIARLDQQGSVIADTTETVACDVLAVGWGLTAQLELPLQAGCDTTIGADGGLVVAVDAVQRTSVEGVWAAGEITGVGGSDLALTEGEIAGRSAAGLHPDDPLLRQQVRRRAKLQRFADVVHLVHPVPSFLVDTLADDVVVCRCEEVTGGELRGAVRELGATDARTVKLLSRVGMGMCQGRMCGFAAACLTGSACERPVHAGDLRAFAERPLANPVGLELLTAAHEHLLDTDGPEAV